MYTGCVYVCVFERERERDKPHELLSCELPLSRNSPLHLLPAKSSLNCLIQLPVTGA